MSKTLDRCLTVSFPENLEQAVVQLLLDCPEWVGGFSIMPIEGFGQAGVARQAREQVRGRAHRLAALVVMDGGDVRMLIDRMRASIVNPEVFYWVMPVLESGRFA